MARLPRLHVEPKAAGAYTVKSINSVLREPTAAPNLLNHQAPQSLFIVMASQGSKAQISCATTVIDVSANANNLEAL